MTPIEAPDPGHLAAELRDALPPLDANGQRVVVSLYRLLAEGQPVSEAEVARRAAVPALVEQLSGTGAVLEPLHAGPQLGGGGTTDPAGDDHGWIDSSSGRPHAEAGAFTSASRRVSGFTSRRVLLRRRATQRWRSVPLEEGRVDVIRGQEQRRQGEEGGEEQVAPTGVARVERS